MIEFNPARCRRVPFKHQLVGTLELLRKPAFALFDEMGAGKTKQVIDAACALFQADVIDTVAVVCPANVRGVWHDTDAELGEIRKHGWASVAHYVFEYHARSRKVWQDEPAGRPVLTWLVTNYEYLRPVKKQDTALQGFVDLLAGRKVLLVLDESSFIKSKDSSQFDACCTLRKLARRCTLLNGTPISQNPLDLWPQLHVLDHKILGRKYQNFYHFKAAHCKVGGWHNKQILGWTDLEKVQRLIAPYAIRRLKSDCLDLPPKLYSQREVPLTPATWKLYKELREECLLTLPDREAQLEPNAAVRLIRLAQLTSGHVGRVAAPSLGPLFDETFVDNAPSITDVSSEKLDWCLDYLTDWSPATHTIVWCRWRRERERLLRLLPKDITVRQLFGGQPAADRTQAISDFSGPASKNGGRHVLVAQPHAGGLGLNLVRATEAVYLSNDYSLTARLQSEDRCHRPGQTSPVTYIDVVATGPKGQKTVDHTVLKALRAKEELARWTSAVWRRKLEQERDED